MLSPRLPFAALTALLMLAPSAARDAVADEAPLVASVAAPDELAVQSRLMAPCCYAGTLADHDSEIAQAMKEEIRERLAAGASVESVVAGYAAEYGERILAAPPPSGFSALPYLLPVAALLGGALVLAGWVRRQTAAARARPADSGRAPAPRSEDLRRVEEWLRSE